MIMSNVNAWIKAARLRTLPLALSCILMGGFLAYGDGKFNMVILILSLVTTLFLQVLSNFANDYGDSVSGVDSEDRKGPSRAVQSGLISVNQMRTAIIVFSFLALASGLALIMISFGRNWILAAIFLVLGGGAIVAAITYTVGRNPYGYAGLGDLFVFVFFGILGVCGSYYLYAQEIDATKFLPAISCGLLSVGVLNVNNVRDIESDHASGKKSIPVRIGRRSALIYHAVLLIVTAMSAIGYGVLSFHNALSWVFILIFPLWLKHYLSVREKTGRDLDPHLKELALSTLLFVILFGIGIVIGK